MRPGGASDLLNNPSYYEPGFGQLPLRGVGRILAMVEGLIGWVTLSLFSMTFVNILQR